MKTLACSLLVIALALSTPALQASTDFGTCGAASLSTYEDIGGCEVGGRTGGILVFSSFGFSGTGSTGAIILDASQIEVTPIQLGLGGGFNFSGFTAGPLSRGQSALYTLSYDFQIDPGPIATGADMGLDPPFGNVNVTQSICADSSLLSTRSGPAACQTPSGGSIASQFFSVSVTNPVAHLTLNPPVLNFAATQTTFALDGGTTGAGFDSLTSTYTVVATPEPLTSMMGLGGLLALGVLRRYRSNG